MNSHHFCLALHSGYSLEAALQYVDLSIHLYSVVCWTNAYLLNADRVQLAPAWSSTA